ncbi:MAG TPA: peroxidase, partial [Burkholderiales bacterium]|nr:peroxidase [Burkholderiales bacterium]
MSREEKVVLDLDDIQSGVLRPRPAPYAATYIVLRIDDRKAGRELMRRVSTVVTSAANPTSPLADTWVSVALTYQGLKALGVPQDSLDSFAWEFRQGMAARTKDLGDVGESSPENWEKPLGTPDVHVVLVAVSPDAQRLEAVLERARKAYQELQGITAIWRQDCHALPTEKEPFGFRDGISHPAIEGSGIPGTNPKEQPLKAGEFVLGYRDEIGGIQVTQPEVLGRNGTYVVFRKLHQRVAAFRQYLKANSISPEDEELLAAKMMGRWRSGAPLALCPFHDDPELGADPRRNNNFLYEED